MTLPSLATSYSNRWPSRTTRSRYSASLRQQSLLLGLKATRCERPFQAEALKLMSEYVTATRLKVLGGQDAFAKSGVKLEALRRTSDLPNPNYTVYVSMLLVACVACARFAKWREEACLDSHTSGRYASSSQGHI